MDSENNRGTDSRQDNIPISSTTLDELHAELLQLSRTINGILGLAIGWIGSKDGAVIIERLTLLSAAIAQGGLLPDSGTFSLPWLAFLLNRSVDATRELTKATPNYSVGSQRMHRSEDLTKPGPDEAAEATPAKSTKRKKRLP